MTDTPKEPNVQSEREVLSLESVLSAYSAETCGDESFKPETLQRFVNRFPQYRAPLLRYASVRLTSVPATDAEIAAEDDALDGDVQRVMDRLKEIDVEYRLTPKEPI